MGTFAKYGFQNVAQKIKLSGFVLRKTVGPQVDQYSMPERMRMCFEELGPSFIKLGQLLSTRPDLIPMEYADEFKKLQDQVSPLPFGEIKKVLQAQFGDWTQVFEEFDEIPQAGASIAQVHGARLKDGTEVVVKVQRPGLREIIDDDVSILYMIADLLQKNFEKLEIFNPTGVVDEFFKSLELETNFIVEANNLRRFAENFSSNRNIVIPKVFLEYTGRNILVMERLRGQPLHALGEMALELKEKLIRRGIRAFFQMVFQHGLFHGDLHGGNLFVLEDQRIGLIDFGVVGRIGTKTSNSIASMFIALATEDYERLAYEYIDLAPYSERTNGDQFARDLRALIAPYFGLSLKNVNFGQLLMSSTSLAARHHLQLPSELMLFFKAIVTVEGLGRQVIADFDLLSYGLEFANELVGARFEKTRLFRELAQLGRESSGVLYGAPRQLKQIFRRLNHPHFALKIDHLQGETLGRSIGSSAKIIYLGILIGSLILGGSMALDQKASYQVLGLPFLSVLFYGLGGFLSMIAFYNYIKK